MPFLGGTYRSISDRLRKALGSIELTENEFEIEAEITAKLLLSGRVVWR